MDVDDPARAKVKSMIQSKIYQKQYQEVIQKQLDGILTEMQSKQFVTVSEYLDLCYEDGFIGTIFDMHGQGVPIVTPIDQESMVRAVQLESKISQGLYTRLGEDVDSLRKKITAEVTRAVATGATYAQTAKRLENQSRIGYNKAVRIARTEGHRIQTTAAMDAMEKAKDIGADVVKQWDAALDSRTRPEHRRVDGEIRELNEPFSNGLMFPGDPAGGAAEVVNCRCALLQRARWALDDGELQTLQDRADFFQLDKADQFDDFKKKFLKAVAAPTQAPAKPTVPQITRDDFPEVFRKSAPGKKATKALADALNAADTLNPNIRKLYTSMDKLPKIPWNGSVTYTGKDHALDTWVSRRTGETTRYVLKLPKMEGADLMGERCVSFHEIGHFIDMGVGDGKKLKSQIHSGMTAAVKNAGASMSKEATDLFADFASKRKTIIDDLEKKYKPLRSEVTTKYMDGILPYDDYKKEWNKLLREQSAERNYQSRNLMGGGVDMLSDIYDALSGGAYQDNGTLIYGHGGRYYSKAGKRNSEIFANYMALSVNRPDLVEMLRRDKPDLCDTLDKMIEEMAGDIK